MTATDGQARQIAKLIAPLRVAPGRKVTLGRDFDPRYKATSSRRTTPTACFGRASSFSRDYQARLAAQDTWGLLVVLQAIDAGGRTGRSGT